MAGGWLSPVFNFQPGVVISGRLVSPITESNCSAKRHHFQALGGFDERFVAPGLFWSILIFSARRLPAEGVRPWVLLGEGSFHQIHGGVATNVPMEQHPGLAFSQEYEQIRGEPYAAPLVDACNEPRWSPR